MQRRVTMSAEKVTMSVEKGDLTMSAEKVTSQEQSNWLL